MFSFVYTPKFWRIHVITFLKQKRMQIYSESFVFSFYLFSVWIRNNFQNLM